MRDGWSPPPVKLNIMSTHGGMGDLIARLPAIRHIAANYPHIAMMVWWQDYFVDLAEYLLPGTNMLKHRPISQAPWEMPKPIIEFDMERLTTLQLHLTDHAFLILLDQLPPTPESRMYPVATSVPLEFNEKFYEVIAKECVIFTAGYTSETRRWPAFHINLLAKKVRAAGLAPVLLGTTKKLNVGLEGDFIKAGVDEDIDRSLFVDLVDRTNLVECLGIIQRARAVVGVDNGLLHLAHCTSTPVVVGYTTLDPKHRVPARPQGLTEVITAAVPCGGCQSRGFAVNHDWRTCIFDDYACLLTMSAERFYTALQKLKVL